ncbi:MAG TPA: bifunctional PIG-L family deacetylase/class I SAM-dependent methyltransferase [Galbitalea sp.]|jgi:LmbE family N-acetylglucosaminyl deacetylase|nr:bifunctional PIG-L family deacetylase/class I SAM-dependent methyltransferase [Galbitalea sp.]
MVIFDATAPGTAEADWSASSMVQSIPPLTLDNVTDLTVIAAHPDDETLGAGGLMAEAALHGISLTVIVITDGGASHPASAVPAAELGSIRSRELREAIAELTPSARILELGLPDGRTDEDQDDIRAALADAIPPGGIIVCPWRGDGHRDHRIVGEICAALAAERGAMLLEYPIWMWHWGNPDDTHAPWSSARVLVISRMAAAAKGRAIDRYSSQVRGLGAGTGESPVLLPQFLDHFTGARELFFVTEPSGGADGNGSKSERYFDELYERNPDPWRLSTRRYESRKRAISIASLPRQRYRAALELGCSVGELTVLVAERADRLLAIDISAAAVRAATSRTEDQDNVRVEHRDAIGDFPAGTFDLILLSEVAYYWDAVTLQYVLDEVVSRLADDGDLLACHWRHPVADYPLRGDEVHDAIRARADLHRLVLHEEEDFVLEVFGRTAGSVARMEGLIE